MIDWVKTKFGLMRKDIADALAENEREREQAKRAGQERLLTAVAKQRGMNPKDLHAVDPAEAVKAYFGKVREVLGPEELARRYPCRTCKLVQDSAYKAQCKALKVLPCFIRARMRGCLAWQEKPAQVGASDNGRNG